MSWIESHQKLLTDPKLFDLSEKMKWEINYTIGALHRFWWWCVDHCRDGDLRGFNDTHIGRAAGVSGLEPCSEFVKAMVDSGFLEREPYFRIAKWWNFAGRFLQSAYSHSPQKWQAICKQYDSNMQADDNNLNKQPEQHKQTNKQSINPPVLAKANTSPLAVQKKPTRQSPEGYQDCMQVISEIWKIRGKPVLITAEMGKMVKGILRHGQTKAMGLLALFGSERWQGWGKTNQGLSCRGLWTDLAKMMESELLKEFEKKYTPATSPSISGLVQIKSIPSAPKDITHDEKVEAYKQLKETTK